jgi:hypothetical protein
MSWQHDRGTAPTRVEHGVVLAGIKAKPFGRPPAGLDPGCGRRPNAPIGSSAASQDPPISGLYGFRGLPLNNMVRLHAGIGYVTPDDEHHGHGDAIRQARRDGLTAARLARIAYPSKPARKPIMIARRSWLGIYSAKDRIKSERPQSLAAVANTDRRSSCELCIPDNGDHDSCDKQSSAIPAEYPSSPSRGVLIVNRRIEPQCIDCSKPTREAKHNGANDSDDEAHSGESRTHCRDPSACV